MNGYLVNYAATVTVVAIVTLFLIVRIERRAAKERLKTALQLARDGYDAQLTQLTQAQASFYQLNEEVNQIVLYMRDAYKQEIAMGHHGGRSVSEIVIGYLSIERERAPTK